MLKTALEVDAKIKAGIPGRWAVGDGAYLQVAKTTKQARGSWLLRYWLNGKTVWVGLGPATLVSLAEARDKARHGRKQRLDGVDPLEDKRAKREAQRTKERARLTFRDAVRQFLTVHEAGWRNAKHRAQWRTTLEGVFPKLGSRSVASIDQALINETLAPIWTKTPETASRIKQRIERVLAWVKEGMPMPQSAASKRTTPCGSSVAKNSGLHGEAPGGRLTPCPSLGTDCAHRHPDGRGARRDLGRVRPRQPDWVIPAARMKAGKEHRVPLSEPAIALLQGLPREEGNEQVFIGRADGGGISDVAMLRCLKRHRRLGHRARFQIELSGTGARRRRTIRTTSPRRRWRMRSKIKLRPPTVAVICSRSAASSWKCGRASAFRRPPALPCCRSPAEREAMTGKGRHPAPPLRYRLEGFQLAFACAMVALYGLSLHAARILAIRLFDGLDGRKHGGSDVGRVDTLRWVASRATPEDVDWLERTCFAIMCSLCAKSEAMRDFARELAEAVSDEWTKLLACTRGRHHGRRALLAT